jgi:hypothetical protein
MSVSLLRVVLLLRPSVVLFVVRRAHPTLSPLNALRFRFPPRARTRHHKSTPSKP